MKTKAEIVQRLLEEKKIDAEEAVVLLMGENKEVQYIPYPVHPQPYQPFYPLSPYYPIVPIWQVPDTICGIYLTSNGSDLVSSLN